MGQRHCCCQSDGDASADIVERKPLGQAYADPIVEENVVLDLEQACALEQNPFARTGSAGSGVLSLPATEISFRGPANPFTLAEKSPKEFTIILRKTPDMTNLGLAADTSSKDYLLVSSVEGGLVGSWNKANPDRAVLPGDRIWGVNGWAGSLEMAQVIQQHDTLNLTVVRIEPEPQ